MRTRKSLSSSQYQDFDLYWITKITNTSVWKVSPFNWTTTVVSYNKFNLISKRV